MNAQFKHISYPFENSFQIEKFDQTKMCDHDGLHFHDSYEIVFVKNGKGRIIIEGNEVNYSNGILVFLGPCIPHFGFSNNDLEDNYEIVIHFESEFIEKGLELFSEFRGLLPLLDKSKQFLILNNNLKEELTSQFDEILSLEPMMQLVSVLKLLYNMSNSTPQSTLLKQGLSEHYSQNKRVNEIVEFINENYQHQVSTKEIAAKVGLSTNSFCRMFKSLTQKSFISYLNEYRINRAMKLLEKTDDDISEISFQCGFENPSYFSKIFSRLKGLTPAEFRKNYRQ